MYSKSVIILVLWVGNAAWLWRGCSDQHKGRLYWPWETWEAGLCTHSAPHQYLPINHSVMNRYKLTMGTLVSHKQMWLELHLFSIREIGSVAESLWGHFRYLQCGSEERCHWKNCGSRLFRPLGVRGGAAGGPQKYMAKMYRFLWMSLATTEWTIF